MPKTVKRKAADVARWNQVELERAAAKRTLQHNIRTEKLIQRLARQLNREVQRTNDRLQQCAVSLSSYARALEAERDVDRSLGGTRSDT